MSPAYAYCKPRITYSAALPQKFQHRVIEPAKEPQSCATKQGPAEPPERAVVKSWNKARPNFPSIVLGMRPKQTKLSKALMPGREFREPTPSNGYGSCADAYSTDGCGSTFTYKPRGH